MTIKKDLTTVNFTAKTSRKILGIVLHSMAGTQAGSIAWFKNPDAKASAHYCIGKDGTIVQCVLDKDIAWHAGVFDEPIADWLRPNPNNVTVGIELEDEANPNWVYPEAQIKSLKELVASLCTMYNISQDTAHILLHKNLNPSRRKDPVGNFELSWITNTETPENFLIKILEENGIDTEGEVRELIGHNKDYPIILADKEACNLELNQTKEQLRNKENILTELNQELNASKVALDESRKTYDEFLNKLIRKLNPLDLVNDEATIIAEIDKLIAKEDQQETLKKNLNTANIKIDELNTQIRTLKTGFDVDNLPSFWRIIKLLLWKKAGR